ncbi:GPI ethanolamine phosphate transferase-like protein [Hapsidospora chrysogenum ATCC 11550]|uniref:GPI ethanolamine phosphate transferase-like protein n=1 Tax=Hapsidospora chrysogenum (strain ATCC 11550 / CBS 779.69 / DSM 880 / IAM 14645 / JCM 23072 / IMI 49137) TaxID=857340 RepID=A0A086T7G2_HAPC1|nr:GPI ethanolamine phosphate transferase-like protein [Hapsidospora chrysogenum ATCC 11550]
MPQRSPKPKARGQGALNANDSEYNAIQQQWQKAKRAAEANPANADQGSHSSPAVGPNGLPRQRLDVLEQLQARIDNSRKKAFERRWKWNMSFWVWVLALHAVAIYYFTSGFLLTRLVLDDKSACDEPPIDSASTASLSAADGCWHPKTFDRAVVVIVDALRYDFTVPQNQDEAHAFHNAFPFLYESAAQSPQNAFLRPFIADPPTTTLQRLKGLTTGTLPTFIDAGSNFAGTAIEEDNLLMQLRDAGKKIAHLGDDTWWSLFPGYFEPNISKAYDSFNVWDLHTVDNGVIDNIFPLIESGNRQRDQWDLLIGHCLGVDHAGHRYGPDHAAMTAKLQQMDEFARKLAAAIDDDTLLVIMGDHGMDEKGDHGGESDDEVEAALWMYSKRPIFGRTQAEFATPPQTAKIRPVNQIDLVPTLALLLGIPIPYNNLGKPIEEAFCGPKGKDWSNLHAVSRMAAAGVDRYQESYFKARGISPGSEADSPADLWKRALAVGSGKTFHREAYDAFTVFQKGTLSVCKDLWARFDVPRMILGVGLAAVGVIALVMYSSRDEDDDFVVTNDIELDYAEKRLELLSFKGDGADDEPEEDYHKELLGGLWDRRVILVLLTATAVSFYRKQPWEALTAASSMTLLVAVVVSLTHMMVSLHKMGKTLLNTLPTTIWGWMAVVFTVSQSVGFASNSYTVWEDTILLFFITTFGIVSAIAAFRIESRVERTLAIYHSVMFVILARVASFSKLCREEQMPFCTSTYYASAASSTSAPWQLAIPIIVGLGLPSIIKSFLIPTRSWEGLSPTWVRILFRSGLLIAALYWVIDAADNGDWFAGRAGAAHVKSVGIYVAQLGLALAFIAGSTAFIWAPPSVNVVSTASPNPGPQQPQARVTILGYGNALGARYLILPLNLLIGVAIFTKPMGIGSLGLMLWQIMSLAEVVDLLGIKTEAIGAVMLAMLGNFYYFRTGHQATLASLQWDSAFVALRTIRYPWSPISVVLNTFGPQILAAACVPLVTCLWKVGPKQKGVLETASRSLGLFVAYYAVEALATMSWAGHLRRHLMLYRVFSPRYMMATALLLVVDLAGVGIAMLGLRSNALAVGEVFGFSE